MRAVAEHHIHQDHGDLGVGRFLQQALVAQAVIDHRMRAAAREHIVAEIDQRVLARLPDVLEPALRIDRRVRPGVAQQCRGFVAERAAAEEAADVALARLEPDARRLDCRCSV